MVWSGLVWFLVCSPRTAMLAGSDAARTLSRTVRGVSAESSQRKWLQRKYLVYLCMQSPSPVAAPAGAMPNSVSETSNPAGSAALGDFSPRTRAAWRPHV